MSNCLKLVYLFIVLLSINSAVLVSASEYKSEKHGQSNITVDVINISEYEEGTIDTEKKDSMNKHIGLLSLPKLGNSDIYYLYYIFEIIFLTSVCLIYYRFHPSLK